jgi:hypothetical protein
VCLGSVHEQIRGRILTTFRLNQTAGRDDAALAGDAVGGRGCAVRVMRPRAQTGAEPPHEEFVDRHILVEWPRGLGDIDADGACERAENDPAQRLRNSQIGKPPEVAGECGLRQALEQCERRPPGRTRQVG